MKTTASKGILVPPDSRHDCCPKHLEATTVIYGRVFHTILKTFPWHLAQHGVFQKWQVPTGVILNMLQ
jgi:hypothetical protein